MITVFYEFLLYMIVMNVWNIYYNKLMMVYGLYKVTISRSWTKLTTEDGQPEVTETVGWINKINNNN